MSDYRTLVRLSQLTLYSLALKVPAPQTPKAATGQAPQVLGARQLHAAPRNNGCTRHPCWRAGAAVMHWQSAQTPSKPARQGPAHKARPFSKTQVCAAPHYPCERSAHLPRRTPDSGMGQRRNLLTHDSSQAVQDGCAYATNQPGCRPGIACEDQHGNPAATHGHCRRRYQ